MKKSDARIACRKPVALVFGVSVFCHIRHDAWAEKAQSLYTSIANKDCHFLHVGVARRMPKTNRNFVRA